MLPVIIGLGLIGAALLAEDVGPETAEAPEVKRKHLSKGEFLAKMEAGRKAKAAKSATDSPEPTA